MLRSDAPVCIPDSSPCRLERALSRWEGELKRSEERMRQEQVGNSDPTSPWYRGPHEARMLEQGDQWMQEAEKRRQAQTADLSDVAEVLLVHHDCVPHFNPHDATQRGPAVAIAPEFEDWEPFRKFKGKCGTLKRPHLPGSGMWWVEMAGVEGGAGPMEDEFVFCCGPVLHQLKYIERPVEVVKSTEQEDAEAWEQRNAMVELAQRNQRGASVDDEPLRKILEEVAYRQKGVDEVLRSMARCVVE